MLKAKVKQIPLLRKLYWQLTKSVYKHQFAHKGYGRFMGVFATFAEAIESAPKTKKIGYDNPKLAAEYGQMLEDDDWEGSGRVIANYDYPVLFWLSQIVKPNSQVFDFGGNVGVHFYAYQKYFAFPQDMRWQVCEVAEIVKIGDAIAHKRGIKNLSFTSEFADICGKDIFLASGSIQYVQNLAQDLLKINQPQHLLINRLPLYDGPQFVTLQNGGQVFYPQYVFNKAKFISDLQEIGYKLIDIWEDRHDHCLIPSHPEKSLPFYYGLYLRKNN